MLKHATAWTVIIQFRIIPELPYEIFSLIDRNRNKSCQSVYDVSRSREDLIR